MRMFKKFGNYSVSSNCPNCGFGTEIKIPKGISVKDFIKGGKCKCDNCQVVFFPEEYTTEYFKREENKNKKIEPKRELKREWINEKEI